jgi:hypothetical protein
MSRDAIRVGSGIQPEVTTVGVPGASDDVRTFQDNGNPRYARPCFVTNTHATDTLYVLPNEIDCSPTDYLAKLAPGQAVDISVEGQLNINFVSLYYATAAYSAALVRGWYA